VTARPLDPPLDLPPERDGAHRSDRGRVAARAAALAVVIGVSAAVAISLHRNGHTQGDDFALYLRQARSLFDGDPAAVVADNRFAVLNSDPFFSPVAYPWGWPIVLAPFVSQWGLDYDRLKLVEVGMLCVFLVLLHGIVRRRIGRIPALAIVAVIGTAPAFAAHTDQLLSEYPYLAAVAVFVWWYDRVRARSTLLGASRADLVVLGLFVTAAFNVRREGVVLVAVIAVMQCVDLVRERDRATGATRAGAVRAVVSAARDAWRPLVTPYVAIAVSAAAFQLLLPTMLFPDNGNSTRFLDERWQEFPATLASQLGLGERAWVGAVVLVLSLIGVVVGVVRRPVLDGPLVVLAIGSALTIGTHLREVERYWLQVTPWVLYFATVALVSAVRSLTADRVRTLRGRRVAASVAVAPLLALTVAHLVAVRDDVQAAQDFNRAGRQLSGPTSPTVAPIFAAVDDVTPATAVIAYPRARTMTLLTDRRSMQTRDLDRILQTADYWAQRRGSTYWQPELSRSAALRLGFVEVWSDPTWTLWRVPSR
jgi:hypothetical protein